MKKHRKPEVVRLKHRPKVVFGRRKGHNPQIITHGSPVSHIVITDTRGGAVKIEADYLPSLTEILARISLRSMVRNSVIVATSN